MILRFLKHTFILLLLALTLSPAAYAVECGDTIPKDEGELSAYIKSCSDKISSSKGVQATLASAIKYLNNQISLTQAQIAATEAELVKLEIEISDLESKISSLNYSLNDLTRLFVSRVQATYKTSLNNPITVILNKTSFSEKVNKLEYLQKARDNDQKIMISLEKTRLDFDAQKTLKESKQLEVEQARAKLASQKSILGKQKTEKDALLIATKNDEAKYQKLLSTARAELEAIQGIIAGKGTETKVGHIGEGDKIATIIIGESACSTGTHLHFEVVQGSSRRNPFDLLKSISLVWDNADSQENGRGDWRWPLNDTIRVTQSYGQTSYSRRYADNFHTGVDMVNKDNNSVIAVKSGDLYRGGMACGGGTLRYVRVKQDDGYDTYYLHVNYF